MVQSHLIKQNSISMNNSVCFCYISYNLNNPQIVSPNTFAFTNITSLHKTLIFSIFCNCNLTKYLWWENVYVNKTFVNQILLGQVASWDFNICSVNRFSAIPCWNRHFWLLEIQKAAGEVVKNCNYLLNTIETCNMIW